MSRRNRTPLTERVTRARKQYERQGLLVEPAVLAEAEREIEAQRAAVPAKGLR